MNGFARNLANINEILFYSKVAWGVVSLYRIGIFTAEIRYRQY